MSLLHKEPKQRWRRRTQPPLFQSSSRLPGDPVGSGLVASLAQPGGNVTGLSSQVPELAGKRLDLLREIVPRLRRLAIMANASNPANVWDTQEFQAAARAGGLDVASFEIRQTVDIVAAFAAFKGTVDALYVPPDAFLNTNRIRINTLALVGHLPTMYGARENVEAAGLISYGPNFADLFRRAGDYVDKILRGTKPADLPVEQPIKFELVVNLITAMALGLEVPLDAARPRRRGDRIELPFAALHMSLPGTSAT